jgi:hypothetical protein
MASILQLPSQSIPQLPKLREVNTFGDYKHNIGVLTQYLASRPTDAQASWDKVFEQLKAYAPSQHNWSFMGPILHDLARILPDTAKQDCWLAANQARKLLQIAESFRMPEAVPLIVGIEFKLVNFDNLCAKKQTAFSLFRFPELECKGPRLVERALPRVTPCQLSDGAESVRLYLQAGDIQSASAVLEHLRIATFYSHSISSSLAPEPGVQNPVPRYVALHEDGSWSVFPTASIRANDLGFNTLETAVLTLQFAPPGRN